MTDPVRMLDWLAGHLAGLQPTFTLIDALYLFVPVAGSTDQANSGGAMRPVMDAFDEIANRTHSTVAVVCHDNKAGGDISGSQVIRNTLKWVVRLLLPPEFEQDPEGGVETAERTLQLNKLKTGKATSWRLRLDGPGLWTFHGTSTTHRAALLEDQLVAYLTDEGPRTVKEIAAGLRKRPIDVQHGCLALQDRGTLIQGSRDREDGKPGRGAMTYGLPTPTGIKYRRL